MNIPYTTYVNYEKETREPNSEMLIKFATFYEVSIDYLIGFSDNPERNNSRFINHSAITQADTLTPDEDELLGDYRQLNTDGKDKSREYTADLTTIEKYTSSDPELKSKSS